MTTPPTLPKRSENRPRYTPAKVLGGFVIVFLAATVMAVLPHRQRELLETTEAPTAVGDHAFFVLRRPIQWQIPTAALHQQTPLYLQSAEPLTRSDLKMRKVTWWRRFHVYQEAELETPADPYYVKIDKGQFLPLGLQPMRPEEENGG